MYSLNSKGGFIHIVSGAAFHVTELSLLIRLNGQEYTLVGHGERATLVESLCKSDSTHIMIHIGEGFCVERLNNVLKRGLLSHSITSLLLDASNPANNQLQVEHMSPIPATRVEASEPDYLDVRAFLNLKQEADVGQVITDQRAEDAPTAAPARHRFLPTDDEIIARRGNSNNRRTKMTG